LLAETLGMPILRLHAAISKQDKPCCPAARAAKLVCGDGGDRSLAVPEHDQRGGQRR
jgi:hypothetical protein